MQLSLREVLVADSQKTLLALDGGGLRGAFTLGVLGEIESMLAEHTRTDRPPGGTFVLADYFDFVGGTSTGAIIATGLSLGWSVDKLKGLYAALGADVFKKRKFLPARAWSKYPSGPLHDRLRQEFGERTFGDPDLQTLLMIVMHNRSSDSPWPLTNNPLAKYNDRQADTHRNLDLKLWELLAASTAAPAYFPPVGLPLGGAAHAGGSAGEQRTEFVDGGVTAHNNPALQMFLTATLPEYKICWPTGPNRLMLVSIGTGSAPKLLTRLAPLRRHIIYVASNTPAGLMFAASNHNDVVCRALAQTRFGARLDNELGTMIDGGLDYKLFTYLRYNIDLDRKTLNRYSISAEPAALAKLDAVKHIDTLMDLGARFARANVRLDHFAGFGEIRSNAAKAAPDSPVA
jgi:uncharacterized protein